MEFLPTLLSPLDESKPSLFEILAEQQLSALIPPSLRYVLAVATHRYPRYLLRVLNNYDELYALLSLIVEKYYLENFRAGFTENFYALKREKVLKLRGGEIRRASLGVPAEVRDRIKLGRRDVWKNLAIMVGIPYLKRKLDESYDIHVAPQVSLSVGLGGVEGRRFLDRDRYNPNAGVREKIMWAYKWFLRRIYPSVNAAYYFSILAFSLGYLFDGTKYSSPFLWMVGTRIRRMSPDDFRAIEEAGKVSLAAATGPGRPGQGLAGLFHPRTLWPRLLSSLRLLLPASIFGLKLLEWWHQSDFSRQLSRKAAEGLELPPPIVSGQGLVRKHRAEQQKAQQDKEIGVANTGAKREPPISSTSYLPIFTVPPPPSSDLCPICLHPIETAAACQTGYVFDFKCVFQWVEGTHNRQEAWMKGQKNEWEDDDETEDSEKSQQSREGKWENGAGRCPVTGRRVLGGTGGIRRVMV